MDVDGRFRLPRWSWSYVTFRYGDGATQALISLAVVLHYDLPLWALAVTTACMNLVGVPATFLWGAVMDRVRDRRAVVVVGFSLAAVAMAAMSLLPRFPLYVAAAMLYTGFGVATSPAASAMVLRGVPRARWALATSSLSRRTGFAFLAGMATAIAVGFLLPAPPFAAFFAGGASVTVAAAALAARTVPAEQPSLPHERDYDAGVAREGQRRFERPVFFPARFRDRPTLRGVRTGLRAGDRLWPLGYALTFAGSVAFFSSYPGVLAGRLGLAAGLVLLCQAPSHIVTPLTYPWAARHGARVGESRGILHGAGLRTVALPGLCLAVVFLGAPAVPLLLALHAVMGLSFALLQVNGPLILAERHPAGHGQGVGLWHAAVGTGTLVGSSAAFVLLRVFEAFWVSYLFAVTLTFAGALSLWLAHRDAPQAPRAEAVVASP